MLYKLGKAFSMDGLSGNEPQRISNAASKLICLLLDDGSSSIKRIGQLDGRQLSQSAWALFQVHTYCKSPEVRQLDLAIADRALQVSPEGAEGCRSWSGVLYNLAKSGISCGSSKEVQQLFTVAVSPPTHSESLS